MAAYGIFARYYNRLMGDVDYRRIAEYFHKLIDNRIEEHKLLLDLACGTGSLSMELARMGYEVIGVDSSPDMLAIASQKSREAGLDILYLCQPMEELDLYGTVDVAVCTLDSINHITDIDVLQTVFDRVALFLDPKGVFMFDANTPYKHRVILGDNSYVLEEDGVFCAWQNHMGEDLTVEIALDFFEQNKNGTYNRESESFSERAYPRELLFEMLQKSGFKNIEVYGENSFTEPPEDCQRYVFSARR